MKLRPILFHFFKFTMRLTLVLVFLGLPAGVLYLREVGVGERLCEQVERDLSGEAFVVTIGRITVDPFYGPIAHDIVIREKGGQTATLASIDEIRLSPNLTSVLSGKLIVERLILADADMAIPLERGANHAVLNVHDVKADVSLLGNQLRLSRFEGFVEGIKVNISGTLLNPVAFRLPEKSPETSDAETDRKKIIGLIKQISALHFPAASPTLDLEVEGDLVDIKSIALPHILLRTGPIEGLHWRLESLELDATWRKGRLEISRLTASDPQGRLNATGEWEAASNSLRLDALCNLNPMPFLVAGLKLPALKDVRLEAPPEIELRASGKITDQGLVWEATGSGHAEGISYKGVKFDSIEVNWAWRNGQFYARDLRIQMGNDELRADVLHRPGDFRLKLYDTIPPTALAGIFDEKTQEFLKNMQFKDSPELSFSFRGTEPTFDAIHGEGTVKLGRSAMRGAWIDWADSTVKIQDRAITYNNLTIARGAGRANGTFTYDLKRQEARMEKIRSTLVPFDVMMWIDPKIAESIKPYRFREPPLQNVNGMVHLKDVRKNDLSIRIDSAEGLDYDLLGRTLKFGRTSAQIEINGAALNASVKKAVLMNGAVNFNIQVSLDPKDPTYSAVVRYDRLNFARMTKLYFDFDDSKGVMSGNFKFKTRMGYENLMQGVGDIRVDDGTVFAIPVLGPFSGILSGIIPGTGYQSARMATADFHVADEKIYTNNLIIKGAGFSMIGHGDVQFMKDKMNMSMRINARGVPGIVLFPVSKLFEYVSTGTVGDPGWRPKLIPKEIMGSSDLTKKPER